MHEIFRKFSQWVSNTIGSVWAALSICALIVATGAYYRFSTEWQAKVSVFASVSALLILVFLQKSQNHSDRATHLKLDELLRSDEGARNEVVAVEDQAEHHIEHLKQEVTSLDSDQ